MKTGIKSYEHAMKIYIKKTKCHMKRYKYSYDKRGFRGFFPNKKHCNTKCVSCDGHREPFSSIYRIIVLPFNFR